MSRLRGAKSVTSRSPIAIVPSVTSSRPASIRRSVDLPQPEGPTSTRNSPSAISSEMSSTAVTAPNRFVTPARLIAAIARRWYRPAATDTSPIRRRGIDQTRDHFYTGAMRLGVEAALVDGVLVRGDVEVDDGRITGIGVTARGGRGIAVPGFVDLQVNGFGGVDFLDADADGYRRAGEALLETGVTAYLPTLITSPEQQLLAAIAEVPVEESRPRILGLHLEGPFLSPNRLGTHEASARRDPDLALLERLLDAGPVRLMTLAPELPGADLLIERLIGRGVAVSLGHTDATAAQAHAAFDCGARSVTHLFNAMRPFLHRDPGIVGAALSRDDVVVSIILDGIPLAPETALTAWRAAGGRLALVT